MAGPQTLRRTDRLPAAAALIAAYGTAAPVIGRSVFRPYRNPQCALARIIRSEVFKRTT